VTFPHTGPGQSVIQRMRDREFALGVVGTECRERLGRLVEVVAGVDGNLESELFASLTNLSATNYANS
jgi:hypothetical protein